MRKDNVLDSFYSLVSQMPKFHEVKNPSICNQTIANSILTLLQMHSDQVFLNFTRLCNNPDQCSFPAMDIDDVKRFAKMVDKTWFFICFTYFSFRWGRTSPLMASCGRALRCTTSTSRSAQRANTHSESLRLRTFLYNLYLHQLLAGGQPGQDRDLLLLHQGDGLCYQVPIPPSIDSPFHPSNYLFIHPSNHLFIHLSIHPSVRPSIHPSIRLSLNPK